MVIEIEVRSVYGRETYYPANDVARSFARIAGTKTLNPGVIQEARKLGYRVLIAQSASQLDEAVIADAMFGGNIGVRI